VIKPVGSGVNEGYPISFQEIAHIRMASSETRGGPAMNNLFRVPVTERTLIQRLNRKLKEHELKLKKCRSGSQGELGNYLVVNSNQNLVARLDSIDLQSLGRGAKVLKE
jgi:hypothetical protein